MVWVCVAYVRSYILTFKPPNHQLEGNRFHFRLPFHDQDVRRGVSCLRPRGRFRPRGGAGDSFHERRAGGVGDAGHDARPGLSPKWFAFLWHPKKGTEPQNKGMATFLANSFWLIILVEFS